MTPAVLLIGSDDAQERAGVAVDSLTVSHHGCHPLPLVTALIRQTSRGRVAMRGVSARALLHRFSEFQQDFRIQAVKIGLIPDLAVAKCIHQMLLQLPNIPVVLDLVLNHGEVAVPQVVQTFIQETLLPLVTIVTPHSVALMQFIGTEKPIETSARTLLHCGAKHCLVKDGHARPDFATDYFVNEDTAFYLYAPRLTMPNVPSAGCVLASSLACHLATGLEIRDAVVLAKAYAHRGIRLSNAAGVSHVIEHRQDALLLQDMPKLCYRADEVGKQFHFPNCPDRLGIYPVVDTAEWVEKLVQCGVTTIQLRMKSQSNRALSNALQQAMHCVRDKPVHFFVNDYWELAVQHQAYGVHLGQEDLHDAKLEAIAAAGLRLGVSTHAYWELARALAVNPSYIALGPMYATTSKQMPFSPQGEATLARWVKLLAGHYPLVAIGGINLERAKRLKATGVGSVAMITAITEAGDYQQATQALLALWQSDC